MTGQFNEIFEVELDCWCYGLSHTTEKIDLCILHKVIKDFSPVIREAVISCYTFDILNTAKKFIEASKCKCSEREIAFQLLSYLPTPAELKQEQRQTLNQIVSKLEETYGGAFQRLEKKWNAAEIKLSESHLSMPISFEHLTFRTKLPNIR